MGEIDIQDAIAERLEEFRPVLADDSEIQPNATTLELTVNVVLMRGLDLMMVECFRRLDDDTLRKSLQVYHQKYPNCVEANPSDLSLSDNELVNKHVELSRRYPKLFFAFMLEVLKWQQSAKARERFHRLFRGD
jgi:hypothetical protein